jgi:serine/threonine protein kinase
MWSLGVIAYMLVSGGVSPFFNRNSVKLERNIVGGNADMEHDSLLGVSVEAKSFIKSLLIVSPTERWSAEQCLKHKWLYSVDLFNPHRSEQGHLETHALRGWLAKRRWVKCCSAVRATLRIVRIREEEEDKEKGDDSKRDPSYLSSDRELWLRSSMLISQTFGRWKIAYM